jgi:hypothetical protein
MFWSLTKDSYRLYVYLGESPNLLQEPSQLYFFVLLNELLRKTNKQQNFLRQSTKAEAMDNR